MRFARLTMLPALALTPGLATALAGCGGGEPGIPSAYHRTTGTGSLGSGDPPATGATGSSGGNGDTGSSTGSSSGVATASSGGSTGGSGGSSGGTGSGSSSGGTGSGSSSGGGGTSSSGASSGGSAPAGNLAITLDPMAVTMQLFASTKVEVTVAPNGYSGTVDLTAASLPAGVTAAFEPSSLTLDGATPGAATLTVTTATNATPGNAPLAVSVNAGATTMSTALAVTVQSAITLHIPAGVNDTGATVSNPNTTAYGPYPITIVAPAGISESNPVTVYFMNDDTVAHEVHADDQAQGFGHDPGEFGAGKMDPYVRQVNTAGTYDFYLHDQGAPITPGRVFISNSQ